MPHADAGPAGWSSHDKFAAVLETAVLSEADLSEYCLDDPKALRGDGMANAFAGLRIQVRVTDLPDAEWLSY